MLIHDRNKYYTLHSIPTTKYCFKFQPTPENFVVQEMSPVETMPYSPNERARNSEQHDEQVLMKLLENHPDIDDKIGMEQEENPLLEYIFQVPNRYYENYQRQSRSVDQNKMSPEDIANILKTHKETLNSLKTDNDADLLLVKHIGSELVNDVEEKLNKIRVKRQQSEHGKMLHR